MEQLWSTEALRVHWVLTPQELLLLEGLSTRRRLVLGYYLKFFQRHAQFPAWLIQFLRRLRSSWESRLRIAGGCLRMCLSVRIAVIDVRLKHF